MLCYRLMSRNLQNKSIFRCKHSAGGVSSSSSSSSDSDTEKPKRKPQKSEHQKLASSPQKNAVNNEALNRLNVLLKQMVEDDKKDVKGSGLNLARPKPENRKRMNAEVKSEPVEKQLIKAATDVAKTIGGDVNQTESELLSKLLTPVESSTSESLNLSELISGMKIDRTQPKNVNNEASRAHQVRQLLQRGSGYVTSDVQRTSVPKMMRKPKGEVIPIDLFGGTPLGIFSPKTEESKENDILQTWNNLYRRELRLMVTHPPENYFQEMILWTNQGKLWKFPIDNEYGLEEEHSISFVDHVFLEEHLKSWCPNRGPIRHFMELVCVGLSKNPYVTVQAKRDHIDWFKNYFMSKKEFLTDVGAIPTDIPKVEQIENK